MPNPYNFIPKIKQYLSLLQTGQQIGNTPGLTCTLDYKQWQKSDITNLATNEKSLMVFYMLVMAAGHAYREGNPESVVAAHETLNEFKPDNCRSTLAFRNMIVQVFNETKERRAKITAPQPNFLKEITGYLLEIPDNDAVRTLGMSHAALELKSQSQITKG